MALLIHDQAVFLPHCDETHQRFVRIERELEQMLPALPESVQETLDALPEAIREKIGFKTR